ncbi:MAG TPA: hypothetical protein VLX68_02340 [Chitinivibrionales bacterium]|nr:hypothetical protein [Chitinivibrionales bacterium]
MRKILIACSAIVMAISSEALYSQTFHETGLSGGGAIFVPTINPNDKNTMFASCDMSGFYRTTDGAATWTVMDYRQIHNVNMCYPAFDPIDKNLMYDATGTTLLQSNDEGTTWNTVRSYAAAGDGTILRIYPDPFNGTNMYVGTDKAVYLNAGRCTDINDAADAVGFFISNAGTKYEYAATSSNVWRSSNNGTNWQKVTPPGPLGIVSFCGGSDGASNTTLWASGTDGKVYLSKTNGNSWSPAPTTGIAATDVGCLNMMSCPENSPNVAYVIVSGAPPAVFGNDSYINLNIYKTTNDGNSWKNVFIANSMAWQKTPPPDPPGDNVTLGWQAFDEYGWNAPMTYGFTCCRTDSNYVIGGGDGELYCTMDGGTTWSECYINYKDSGARGQHKKWQTNGLNVTSTWNYYICPTDSMKHYICYTDIGFAHSFDGGITWTDSWTGSPFANTFYAIAFDPKVPGTVYAAASDDHDIPDGWEKQMMDPNLGGGPVVSIDYGQTWAAMNWTGLTESAFGGSTQTPYPCTGIALSPDGNAMYIAEYGDAVYKSVRTNGTWGAWTNLNVPAVGANKHYYKIVAHKDGTVFVGMCERLTYSGGSWGSGSWQTPDAGALFVSTNGGAVWKNIAANVYNGSGLHGQRLYGVDPNNSSMVYICGTPSRQGDNGVYKTANQGASWTAITPQGVLWPEDITVDPSFSANVYLSTNDQAFFSSTDGGSSWNQMPFPFAVGNSVYVDSMNKYLYLCTFGCGVWTNAPSTGAAVLPYDRRTIPLQARIHVSAFGLPHSGVMLSYGLQSRCCVQLDVYTISGEKVASLVHGIQEPGEHGISVSGGKLPAGLYLCHFQAGSYRESNRIFVIK